MTPEIGVRVALGAQRCDIARLVVRRGLWTVGAGLAIGVAAAFGCARAVATYLYGVSPNDPASYACVTGLLAAVAALAAAGPVRRAMAVDPAEALRE